MLNRLKIKDGFVPMDDVYDLSKSEHKRMWKLYDNFKWQSLEEKLKKKKAFKKFAKDRTGLNFSKITIEIEKTKGNVSSIGISLTDTKNQDLGFYGNYITELQYNFYGYNAWYNLLTKQFKIFFSCGIDYVHKSGGTNGVRDHNWLISYNINTDKLEIREIKS